MSSGRRSIITNSCLSNVPSYLTGFYKLTEGQHKELDSIRARFFWQGGQENFRYHMVKWEALCRPKDFGGLGVLNTQIMNECLLVKWIWRIIHNRDAECCQLLYNKYMRQGNFYTSSAVGSSQFWKGLHNVKHLFKWGAVHKVHNGQSTSGNILGFSRLL